MSASYFTTLENIHNQVNRSTIEILKHVKDESIKTNYLKELEEILISCIGCEHKVAILRQATKEAVARSRDESTGTPNASLFDDLLEESIGELELDSPLKEALVQAPSLKAFKELQEKHNATQDTENSEGIITTDCGYSLIDPISKKRMTDPVRNKNCRHVYDRNSVTSMITARSNKNGFKCPTIGCSNRRAIKLTDLEDARDVRMQLSLQQSQE